MKRCIHCGKEHPDSATRCQIDSNPLESFTPLIPKDVPLPTRTATVTLGTAMSNQPEAPKRLGYLAWLGIIFGGLIILREMDPKIRTVT
jgi:hypothetical protein